MMTRILQNYYLYLEQVRRVLFANPGSIEEAVSEHRQIFLAVKEQDGEKAERTVKQHIANTMKQIDSYGWENITGGKKDGEN